MLFSSQLSRASRRISLSSISGVSRIARPHSMVQTRGFIAPTISRRADFVQELYLRELKAFKPTPIRESDSEGQVQKFNVPKTPPSPEEADLASSLKEYESMAVEIEGQDGPGGNPVAALPDWFEEGAEEEDQPSGH